VTRPARVLIGGRPRLRQRLPHAPTRRGDLPRARALSTMSPGRVAPPAAAARRPFACARTDPRTGTLLASGEHAAFTASRPRAVACWRRPSSAQSQGAPRRWPRPAGCRRRARRRPVRRCAHGAVGRCRRGRAPEAPAERSRCFAALAAATIRSVHRSWDGTAVARASDLEALELTDGSGRRPLRALVGWPRTRWGSTRPRRRPIGSSRRGRWHAVSRSDEWCASASASAGRSRGPAAQRAEGSTRPSTPAWRRSSGRSRPGADGTSLRAAHPGIAQQRGQGSDPSMQTTRRHAARAATLAESLAHRAADLAGAGAARRAGREQDPRELAIEPGRRALGRAPAGGRPAAGGALGLLMARRQSRPCCEG
jgi:hypothetical protein